MLQFQVTIINQSLQVVAKFGIPHSRVLHSLKVHHFAAGIGRGEWKPTVSNFVEEIT